MPQDKAHSYSSECIKSGCLSARNLCDTFSTHTHTHTHMHVARTAAIVLLAIVATNCALPLHWPTILFTCAQAHICVFLLCGKSCLCCAQRVACHCFFVPHHPKKICYKCLSISNKAQLSREHALRRWQVALFHMCACCCATTIVVNSRSHAAPLYHISKARNIKRSPLFQYFRGFCVMKKYFLIICLKILREMNLTEKICISERQNFISDFCLMMSVLFF